MATGEAATEATPAPAADTANVEAAVAAAYAMEEPAPTTTYQTALNGGGDQVENTAASGVRIFVFPLQLIISSSEVDLTDQAKNVVLNAGGGGQGNERRRLLKWTLHSYHRRMVEDTEEPEKDMSPGVYLFGRVYEAADEWVYLGQVKSCVEFKEDMPGDENKSVILQVAVRDGENFVCPINNLIPYEMVPCPLHCSYWGYIPAWLYAKHYASRSIQDACDFQGRALAAAEHLIPAPQGFPPDLTELSEFKAIRTLGQLEEQGGLGRFPDCQLATHLQVRPEHPARGKGVVHLVVDTCTVGPSPPTFIVPIRLLSHFTDSGTTFCRFPGVRLVGKRTKAAPSLLPYITRS